MQYAGLGKLGITKEETMAFGDYLNDYEMLQESGLSYAMKNSHPDLLKVARFVTEYDNNNNGVVETIRKVLILKSAYYYFPRDQILYSVRNPS